MYESGNCIAKRTRREHGLNALVPVEGQNPTSIERGRSQSYGRKMSPGRVCGLISMHRSSVQLFSSAQRAARTRTRTTLSVSRALQHTGREFYVDNKAGDLHMNWRTKLTECYIVFAIAAGLSLTPFLLAAHGFPQRMDRTPKRYSRSLVVARNAIDPQFHRYPDGREQVVYTINVEYPAKKVVRRILTGLRREGWKPLPHNFLNPEIPSSLVRGWQEVEDETQKPPMMVRGWGADWENAIHDVTEYNLEYRFRYPEEGPPDLTKLRVVGLYIPAAVVNRMKREANKMRREKQPGH